MMRRYRALLGVLAAVILGMILVQPVAVANQTKPLRLPAATIGAAYAYPLESVLRPKGWKGRVGYYIYLNNGPFGLTMDAAGRLTGVPARVGTTTFRPCASKGIQSSCRTVRLTVGPSRYAGTYTGTLSFRYQDRIVPDPAAWASGSITLTVTLADESYVSSPKGGTLLMKATNAIVSDPGFGTGSAGVTPTASSMVQMPANPIPGTPDGAIALYFPNGSAINLTEMTGVIASPDARTLAHPMSEHPQAWLGWYAGGGTGPLSAKSVAYDDWTLTKVG